MPTFATIKTKLMETEIFDVIVLSDNPADNVQASTEQSDKEFDSYGFYPDASF